MVRIEGQGDGCSLIQVRGLDKTYQRGSEEIHVLQGLNLDVDAGDFVEDLELPLHAAILTCLPCALRRAVPV